MIKDGYSSFLCVLNCRFIFLLQFSVSVVSLFSSLIVDMFTSVIVCNPDVCSLNRCMTFKQRCTTVAFIFQSSYVPIVYTSFDHH